jgi:hypothetical protein
MGWFRRAQFLRAGTGRGLTDQWLAAAQAELSSASRTPYTLRFYRGLGEGNETADSTLVGLIPFLQERGHAVVNVSGGGSSPVAYLTVVPKHLAPAEPSQT